MRLCLLSSVFVAGAGCSNPKYCADQPGQMCVEHDAAGSGDATTKCTSDTSCAAPTPVCDTASMACVQCTTAEPGACGATSPVCGSDDTCHPCTSHSQCASNACLPDGSCGDDTSVAYVDPTGAGSSCTKAAPCNHVSAALATNRPNVKISGTIDEAVTLNNSTVTLIADPGARLQSTGNIVFTVSGSTDVRFFDLAIGPSANTYQDIRMVSGNPKVALTRVHLEQAKNGGIIVDAGQLTVTSSRIADNTGAGGIYLLGDNGACSATIQGTTFSGNSGGAAIIFQAGSLSVSTSTISDNQNGGIYVASAPFQIVGNLFINNGTSSGNTGGVMINASQAATNRLDFNTFVKNHTMTATGPAIQCTAGTFTAKNNIMVSNVGTGSTAQYGGTCAHAYSVSTPGTVPPGNGNLGSDPMFVDFTGNDLHLMAASPARGAADPAADLTGIAATDIDGDARIAPADIGADQFKL